MAPEDEVDAGFEAVQSVPFHQLEAELTEAIPRLIVAEVRPQHRATSGVGEARSVAVAVLQAEIHHAADHEAAQVHTDVQGRRHDRMCRTSMVSHATGSAHPRQVEQRLDRAVCRAAATVRSYSRRTSSGVGCADHRRRPDTGSRGPTSTALSNRPRNMKSSTRSQVMAATSRRVAVRRARSASRSSASASAPVRNSHSARCRSSAKMSSCQRSHASSGSSAAPAAR